MDIDFTTDLVETFAISLEDNPQPITGNRALINRFEIVFMTKQRPFLLDDEKIIDTFGGDAEKYINRPQVLNNLQSIAAAISAAVDQTVKAIFSDQNEFTPLTEKLQSANLIDIQVVEGVVYARIQVNPVEVEPYSNIQFNLPIIRR